MTCACPTPYTVPGLVEHMDCEDFKYHLVDLIDQGVEERYASLVEEWEAEILWGIQR
jgi:hypothetical protein